MTELDTEQLHLRPLELSDLDAVNVFHRDPRMRRYIGDGHPLDFDESRRWLTGHVDGWREHGYGFFALELRSPARFIGWFGLNTITDHPELDGEVEIGGSIDPQLWGRGLAAEAAREVLEHGFSRLGIEHIVARFRSDNRASGAVVEKLGMEFWKEVAHLELPEKTIMVWHAQAPSLQRVSNATAEISSDRSRLDRNLVHGYLSTSAPWALGFPREALDRAIDHSVCVGAYVRDEQVGFARAVTDQATFAYIDDVFVLDDHRRSGLAGRMVEALMDLPELRHVKSWWLLADDPGACRLFGRLGFDTPEPERLARWMTVRNRSRGYWLRRL